MSFQSPNNNKQPRPKLERRQLRLIRKIYGLKIWLILLILLLLTIIFYIVSFWLEGNISSEFTWLRFIPWVSLATTSLSVVVIGIAYEWIVRDEAEQKLNQVLEQHFQSQADIIEKMIPTAILTTPNLMRRILTPESVDDAVLASLEVRLNDARLAKDVYDNLFSQLLISEERRSNYKCKVSLTTIKDAKFSDEIKLTYYEGYVDIHYETILRKDTFRYVCVATTEEYNQLLPDTNWELRWIIEPTRVFPKIDESVFDIESVTVDGMVLNIKREYQNDRFVIVADHPGLKSILGKHVEIDYRYRSKFQKRGHLLMINVPCPTKNVAVELDYSDTDIHYVNIQDLLVSKAKSVIHYFPSQNFPRRIEIAVNEWVFPKGGVVFVWVLRSEMTPGFLKLLAQNRLPARPDSKITHQLPPALQADKEDDPTRPSS